MTTALIKHQATRLGAVCLALALGVLLALSGPHLVHHLLELPVPDDHHGHHDAGLPQPDCLVLGLWQHTPVISACVFSGHVPYLHAVFLVMPFLPDHSNLAAQVLHARAPPRSLLV